VARGLLPVGWNLVFTEARLVFTVDAAGQTPQMGPVQVGAVRPVIFGLALART
jgi:hypothetical protein